MKLKLDQNEKDFLIDNYINNELSKFFYMFMKNKIQPLTKQSNVVFLIHEYDMFITPERFSKDKNVAISGIFNYDGNTLDFDDKNIYIECDLFVDEKIEILLLKTDNHYKLKVTLPDDKFFEYQRYMNYGAILFFKNENFHPWKSIDNVGKTNKTYYETFSQYLNKEDYDKNKYYKMFQDFIATS